MELWLDSCNSDEVLTASRFGNLFGVTTNPSLLAKATGNPEKIISKLLEVQDGPVAVQVIVDQHEDILRSGMSLHKFSDRIFVKVPVTQEGLIAMKQLTESGVSVMATAVFHPNQALLAALAGAKYVAPYVGRMFDVGIDAYPALQSMLNIYRLYDFKTKILAAALRTPERVTACAELGVSAATLKYALFEQFHADDPNTSEALHGFDADWRMHRSENATLLV